MNGCRYIWQADSWPNFSWRNGEIQSALTEAYGLRGQLFGKLSLFQFEEVSALSLDSLTSEIVTSAKIEGADLDRDSVRSSISNHLGLEYGGLPRTDHYVDGVVQTLLDAATHCNRRLEAEHLFAWHRALFPSGYSGMAKIDVGMWRRGEEPMQVVSRAFGRQKVHFQAPPSDVVPGMMGQFLDWLDGSSVEPLIKAAVAHLWFVTIHPFDDGNGRLCRLITEMLLARADSLDWRCYSLSAQILRNRKSYYSHLENAQKGSLDISDWVKWFLETLVEALRESLAATDRLIYKVKYWQRFSDVDINARQRKLLNALLDGFNGKLTSSKYYKINHCSQDTATRDLSDLVAKGLLRKSAEGGRGTHYELIDSSEI